MLVEEAGLLGPGIASWLVPGPGAHVTTYPQMTVTSCPIRPCLLMLALSYS